LFLDFTHPNEIEFRKSFNGLGAIDLDILKFVELTDQQKKRAIARCMVADKKKEAKEEEIRANKEKKEAERLAKLAKKEAEKEGKRKAKGKKKVAKGGQAPVLSTVDQNSKMVGGSRNRMKSKAVLPELTEEMVIQGTLVIVIGDDDEVTSKESLLENV